MFNRSSNSICSSHRTAYACWYASHASGERFTAVVEIAISPAWELQLGSFAWFGRRSAWLLIWLAYQQPAHQCITIHYGCDWSREGDGYPVPCFRPFHPLDTSHVDVGLNRPLSKQGIGKSLQISSIALRGSESFRSSHKHINKLTIY
jgi:hypothetical protein